MEKMRQKCLKKYDDEVVHYLFYGNRGAGVTTAMETFIFFIKDKFDKVIYLRDPRVDVINQKILVVYMEENITDELYLKYLYYKRKNTVCTLNKRKFVDDCAKKTFISKIYVRPYDAEF